MSGSDLFSGTPHFRRRSQGEEQQATTLELFYDLVFVFAITQVSHLAARAPHAGTGAGQAALVLLVVWWAWNYTTWVTNELDPDVDRRAAAADRADAREPADGDRDPGGVRRARRCCSPAPTWRIQVGRHRS